MNELFDVNLLSQIKGIDKKLSISREQVQLKRQVAGEQKHEGHQHTPKKPVAPPKNEKSEDMNEHRSVDIVV
ncbi:MAG: hypothetical protein NTX75_02315 [Proteobacteria bacterium]|nr:hypothetical protein [Pseudomonadota bacterium]